MPPSKPAISIKFKRWDRVGWTRLFKTAPTPAPAEGELCVLTSVAEHKVCADSSEGSQAVDCHHYHFSLLALGLLPSCGSPLDYHADVVSGPERHAGDSFLTMENRAVLFCAIF